MPQPTPVPDVLSLVLTIRGQRVILDSELAKLYGVPTKVFNQTIQRNAERFPADFLFQITEEELELLRSQIVTSKAGRGGRRYLPYVFTEYGALMAATVLNSARAVQMSNQEELVSLTSQIAISNPEGPCREEITNLRSQFSTSKRGQWPNSSFR